MAFALKQLRTEQFELLARPDLSEVQNLCPTHVPVPHFEISGLEKISSGNWRSGRDAMVLSIAMTIHKHGAGGGTRTHTTLPSRDFKSLASTSSATSAPLFLIGFSPRGNECFSVGAPVSKTVQNCSLCVSHPIEGPDDVRRRLDVPGVVLAHAVAHAGLHFLSI
jgi:hypothetical protein